MSVLPRFLCSALRGAFLLACLGGIAFAAPAKPAGQAQLSPAEGELTADTTFTLSFVDAVVPAGQIGAGDVPWPIVIEPKLEGRFLWQSTTEGELTLKGPVLPGTHYRISTAPGLKDARGQALPPQSWEFDSPNFEIRSAEEDREPGAIAPMPRVALKANYPVSLVDAAEHVFFQDRTSHERRPAEIAIDDDQEENPELRFTVSPREPLPPGHSYDLILDGVADKVGHRPLPFLGVVPVGDTDPLKISWVGAFNQPMEAPLIRVKFAERIDPETATPAAVTLTPPVPDLKAHAEEDELVLEGAFDLKQHYAVQIGTQVLGERGFGLAASERWGATFHPKTPTIVFPEEADFQRSAHGLKFSFLQVNTGPVTWKLSPVSTNRLAEILARAAAYHEGEAPLDLPVVGQGHFEANGPVEEILRQIDWQPAQLLSGPYLLEVTAPGNEGPTVGNRSLICFSDYVLTQKRTAGAACLRVAKMKDGRPAGGLRARALTADGVVLGQTVTDRDGVARFARADLFPEKKPPVALFLVETPVGLALQYADAPQLGSVASSSPEPSALLRGLVVTDRNLYRPGQTVKIHGTMRWSEGGALRLPKEQVATWQIRPVEQGQPVASGTAPVNAHGSWEAEWNVPADFQTGSYEIWAGLGGAEPVTSFATVQVEEYRAPLFSVELTPVEEVGAVARVKLASAYFHGAPNAGAKVHWNASWSTSMTSGEADQFYRSDDFSEHHPDDSAEIEVEGDAVLDAQGQALLACEPPYKDHQPRGRSLVSWRVDVTSPEAQTYTGGAESKVQLAPAWAGLRSEAVPGPKPAIGVEVSALQLDDGPANGTPVHLELFHVRARTVKEKIAPYLSRYRNTREFEKVAAQDAVTPARVEFPVHDSGEYVAVLTGPGGAQASDNLILSGDDLAELPVENDTEIKLSLPEPVHPYHPGEIAPISVAAPFPGVAWVTVETDEVLDTLLVPLAGNAGRIDLPVKKEYAPNATVSVYLLQPGGEKNLPRERFGHLDLQVERPDRSLEIETTLAAASVKPGAPVHAELRATSGGVPVAGAEFVVFAVDEAVLRLGDWKLPDSGEAFYPERSHTVSTLAALSRFVEQIDRKSLLQKGYVVGDGGDLGSVALRKEFKTLAFWKAGLLTDAQGKIEVDFPAPDNLTEYRLVAIGSTDANQFGGGSSTFKVSKPLLCEPALPRFARFGDELTLRAVVRQTAVASGRVTVRCTTEGIEGADGPPQSASAASGVPAVFTFKGRASDASSATKVRFEVTSDFGEQDAVEVSLPLSAPTVLRHETFATKVTGPVFQPAQAAPASWSKGLGAYDVSLSTSPWLPKLNGLPAILGYPHGCFEQISTRVLSYALMTDLLRILPDTAVREGEYRAMLKTSLARFEESLLPSGMLPYWPGEEESNAFVTVLAAWAVRETEHGGLEASASLRATLDGTLAKIVKGEEAADPFTRSLALMVSAKEGAPPELAQVAEDLYLKRNGANDEARALLALAMQEMKALPKEQAQLVKEISAPPAERAFEPRDFSSTDRAEAITALALFRLAPGSAAARQRSARLLELLDRGAELSTQENLWLLLAFKAMHDAEATVPLPIVGVAPAPALLSQNGASMAWTKNDLSRLSSFQVEGLPAGPLTALVAAEYRSTEPEKNRTDRGLRVERVTRDLTDPQRAGTAEAPFKLGDQILVTYRLVSPNRLFYVALEDLLPAGLETVNPDLPALAKTFQLPPAGDGSELALSHSELRDQSTCLYFDRIEPGAAHYSVLARATTAGSFHWPAAQAYPMYDARFTGLSTAGTCVVKE